ncbi:hypothetical protein [Streptomyces sp. Amel2xC10]|uniref:DUF6941 family protein n=1 Tax=Streptomyces sp. Amel2xC10 TaxID=1305826 RepID=UPI003567AD6D
MLCDHAQVAEGKLFISGGGWSVTGPLPSPSALALKIEVPWDQANTPIKFALALVDQDGKPVQQQGPLGLQPLRLEGQVEVGRPPGLTPGTPLDVPLAIGVGALPLAPGGRFTWRLELNGRTEESWQLSFSVRGLPGNVRSAPQGSAE